LTERARHQKSVDELGEKQYAYVAQEVEEEEMCVMNVYTIREAARETKIGMEALKRACAEKLIKATKLTNGQWRIAESALTEALHAGIDFAALPKTAAPKRPQPAGLKKFQEAKLAQAQAATTTTPAAKAAATTKTTKAKAAAKPAKTTVATKTSKATGKKK
jgi:hypothetical protein